MPAAISSSEITNLTDRIFASVSTYVAGDLATTTLLLRFAPWSYGQRRGHPPGS